MNLVPRLKIYVHVQYLYNWYISYSRNPQLSTGHETNLKVIEMNSLLGKSLTVFLKSESTYKGLYT